jgi:uncharacterized protein YdeI (YjbR/CyaY-like superfamily)
VKRELDENELLYVKGRTEWRTWLKKHCKSGPEVWLVFYKKHTGRSCILYNDAVEEALCFGWIDSTVRRIDADRYAQRFSPRKSKSHYSQANMERLRALAREGKVAKEVLATLGNLAEEDVEIPPDILKAIRANKEAWRNLKGFSRPYVRIRIAFIEGARNRPAEFEKRLRYFIKMTEKNKQFGFGGIEKYY